MAALRRLLIPLLFATPMAWAAAPASLHFCHEDQDSYPWVLRDRPGLNIHMMRLLERELKIPFKLVPMPWKRCLAEMAKNNVHGAFAASYKLDRLEMGHYPAARDGKPDPAFRMHTSSYSLYRLKGSALNWNGKSFEHLAGQIGTLSAHSVIDFLRERGVSVDDGSKNPVDTLRKVQAGRLQGAALQTSRTERILSLHPDLARSLERVPLLLEERNYFLMLSPNLAETMPDLASTIWRGIEKVRESAEYKRIEQDFYGAN
jgi:polar amino acid transport system substrate-binding protein